MTGVVQGVVVEFFERLVFVEVLPGLIVGSGDSVEVFWRPADAENASGDVLDKFVQALICVVFGVR